MISRAGLKAASAVALALAAWPGARAGRLDSRHERPDFGQTFTARSDLVVLQVAVHDKRSEPVPDLTRDDFQVFEDRVPQQISFFVAEDRPAAVGLVVDCSMSMATKHDDVIAAAEAFVRSSNPDDALFTVNFNEQVSFGLPDGMPFTSDPTVLHAALSTIRAGGETALYDAVAAALAHVNAAALDQKVLIVVSDGDDNRSRLTFADVLERAERPNEAVYTVGLFDQFRGGNRRVLRRLADATGGMAFFPKETGEVRPAFDRIARDIRHRYTIGYVSTNARRDGTFRQVRVAAIDRTTRRPLSVRVREGYRAPSEKQP